MISRWLLHEPAQKTDDERNVRAGMNQVPEAANDTSIERGIDRWFFAILAQLASGLHWRANGIALCHLCLVEQLPCVRCLGDSGAPVLLPHLQSKIISEEAQITH